MSGAIVAKSINDSLGTNNFKGLNTILHEELTQFNETLSETLVEYINELKSHDAKGLRASDKVSWVLLSYGDSQPNPLTVNYDGVVKVQAIERQSRGDYTFAVSLNGALKNIVLTKQNEELNVSDAEGCIYLSVKEGDVLSAKATGKSPPSTGGWQVVVMAEVYDFSGIRES
jgi:hypothetical protein